MLECLADKSTLSFQRDVCITITTLLHKQPSYSLKYTQKSPSHPRGCAGGSCSPTMACSKTILRLCMKLVKNVASPNKWLYLGLVSSNVFMNLWKFMLQATNTPTRLSHGKLACILLYVVSAPWSLSGGFSILPTLRIINMFFPRYSGSPSKYSKKHVTWVEWARQQL